GAHDPFDDIGIDFPSGVTPASGGGPSLGASTRTSWPSVRRARARPSTWPCTPPGIVREYGQTRPTRTSSRYLAHSIRPISVWRISVRGPVGLHEVPLLGGV